MAGKRYSEPTPDDKDVKINQTVYTNSEYTGIEAKQSVTNNTNKSTETITSSKSSNLSISDQTGSPNGDDNDAQDGQYVVSDEVDKINKDQVSKIQYLQQNNPNYFESIGENPDDLLSSYMSDTGTTYQDYQEEDLTDLSLGTIIDENGFTYISDANTITNQNSTETVTTVVNPQEILKVNSIFAHPTNHKGTISSPFGFRILIAGGKWEFHGGTDISAPNGTKVYAVYDGVIKESNSSYVNQIESPKGSKKNIYGQSIISSPHGFGNSVWLEFDSPTDKEKYIAIYGHLQNVVVTKGQKVVKGQVLGTIGDSGFSYGNHLHFELRYTNPNKKTILKTDYNVGYNGRKASGNQTGYYGVNRITDDTGDWIVNNTTVFADPKRLGIV